MNQRFSFDLSVKLKCKEVQRSYLVTQKLSRQNPEGVDVEETTRQVDKLKLLHFWVDEELSGGERRSAWSGWIRYIYS